MGARRLIEVAANLLGDDDTTNPEYGRAVAEVVTDYLGLPMDAMPYVADALRVKKEWTP